MPTSIGLDLDAARQPIPGDNPAGANLRADSSFNSPLRNLRDKAREARTKEREARDGKSKETNPAVAGLPDWQAVRAEGWSVLCEKSKDLDVMTFLLEGLTRTDGFAGICFGFSACAAIVREFWDAMLARAKAPAEGEEGAEPLDAGDATDTLVRLLGQLNENELLTLPISYIPITSGSAGGLALWQYKQASEAAKQSPEERERLKLMTLEVFEKSVAETDAGFFQTLDEDVRGAIAAIHDLEAAFSERLGDYVSYAPSFSNILAALEDVAINVRYLAKDKLPGGGAAAGGAPGAAATSSGAAAGGNAAAGFAPGQAFTREQAFQQLSRIADFFAETEPLSLLAEQIRLVVHRGRLKPEEYFRELIESDDTLARFFKTVGIRGREES